jgi:hypothetical protein
MNRPEDEKKRLADALGRMAGETPQQEPVRKPVESTARPVQPPPSKSNPRVRPAFPTLSTQDPESAGSYDQPPPVDDDRVQMPAPTPQDLMATRRAAVRQSNQKSQSQSLRTRRTIVPILLTLGVMLPALGGLWFVTDEDSPFRALSVYVPVSLILFGLVLLVAAILNVLYLSQYMGHAKQ